MALAQVVRRRWDGDHTVDPWGLDTDLVELVAPLAALRWSVDGHGGSGQLSTGPAVVVFNRQLGWSEPFVVVRALHQATGRFLRVVGAPDRAPVGPALRRLGAVLHRPDELAGLLRAGEVAALPLGRSLRNRHHAGRIDLEALAPALATGAPVVPAAVVGREVGRRWRVRFGAPIHPPVGRSPMAAAELADAVRLGVQGLIDATVRGSPGRSPGRTYTRQ
ncbi:hypothetical protein BH24ACT3_BH24ACT3_00750 [soil metagenome]